MSPLRGASVEALPRTLISTQDIPGQRNRCAWNTCSEPQPLTSGKKQWVWQSKLRARANSRARVCGENDWLGLVGNARRSRSTSEHSHPAVGRADEASANNHTGGVYRRSYNLNYIATRVYCQVILANFYCVHINYLLSRMIGCGKFRIHVAQRRLLEARGLHMIQRPASGAFDLELGKLTHSGEKSFAAVSQCPPF